jgi:hypothetical protein
MATPPQPPKASAAKVAYHQKQLGKMLARSGDIPFLQFIWSIDALQSGRAAAAAAFITFPPQAADSSINSPLAIHRWELETLVIQLFLTAKQIAHEGANLTLNCSTFEAMRVTVNRLRSLENVESALYLSSEDFNILDELHRIAHREFHWQQGYFNPPQFYRYLFMYGQGQCAEYFQRTYGIAVSDFALTAFGYFAAYQRAPWIGRVEVPHLGLTRELLDNALPMMSVELANARKLSVELVAGFNEQHGRPIPTAYLPSVLRRAPLIFQQENRDNLIAPIPEIILIRATAGLYFDIVSGGQPLLNEANRRFEEYCVRFISAMTPRFEVAPELRYGTSDAPIDSPDVMVKDDGKLVLAVECKATKLTYLAQFAEDPFEAQRKQYQQISKGIFQLWRFFSHVRRGVVPDISLAPNTYAMVVTLDPFGMVSRTLRANIFKEATRLADREGDISVEDRRHVILCPVVELEHVLSRSDEDIFLEALHAAQQEQYIEWQFREIHRAALAVHSLKPPSSRRFPFDLGELLPWWDAMRDRSDEWTAREKSA